MHQSIPAVPMSPHPPGSTPQELGFFENELEKAHSLDKLVVQMPGVMAQTCFIFFVSRFTFNKLIQAQFLKSQISNLYFNTVKIHQVLVQYKIQLQYIIWYNIRYNYITIFSPSLVLFPVVF